MSISQKYTTCERPHCTYLFRIRCGARASSRLATRLAGPSRLLGFATSKTTILSAEFLTQFRGAYCTEHGQCVDDNPHIYADEHHSHRPTSSRQLQPSRLLDEQLVGCLPRTTSPLSPLVRLLKIATKCTAVSRFQSYFPSSSRMSTKTSPAGPQPSLPSRGQRAASKTLHSMYYGALNSRLSHLSSAFPRSY